MKYFFVFIFLSSVVFGFAQKKTVVKEASHNTSFTASFDSTLYNGIRWREIGPFRGGRSGTVTGVKGKPNLYYFGSVGGGVWKSDNSGQTWSNITDGFFGGTIGAVAVAESDPNVIYVGEGEQTVRNNVSSGWGMWKSVDAGKTWKHIGLRDSKHIGRIRIDPKNPDLLYVAVMGNLWKSSDVRGVYRSKDGGKTWQRILFASKDAGAVDLILDPNDARTIYASTWNIRRNGWRMDSGGPDSKLWKSTNGGDTWENLSAKPGMPKGTLGIIGVTVSPKNSNRVWASIEAAEGGVFRSDDAGKTWTRVNQDRALLQRAWYYCRIYADTQDENVVYVMNVSYGRSKDGGKTFQLLNAPHGDHHDLWIDPQNNQRMVIADDGGAQISNNGGEIWSTYHNQPTGQFYRVVTDNHFPYRIYGAQQDNTSVRIAHRTSTSSITERDWDVLDLGESAHLAPDPLNNDLVYGSAYKGNMKMQDMVTGQIRSTNVWPDLPAGSGADIMKYRFNWNYPIGFSPHDPKKLYAGSNHLHVSYNGGQSWEAISPDLTRNEPATIKSSGGPITQDNTGAEYYANLFVITESPYTKDEIWVGSDDGLLHLTQDGGKHWKNITPPTSPKYNMMNSIEVNPFVKGGAYVVATSYKFDDYTPYIYKTTDYGKTWKVITNGIPKQEFARVVRADPKRKGLLYAGTEKGMWFSVDDGETWNKFQLNLPPVPVHDLTIKNDNLIAATHGRSFWMIDDLTPLHQLSKEIAAKSFYLYKPMASYRMEVQSDMEGLSSGGRKLEGENHPDGVIVNYFVKDAKDSAEVKLDFLQTDGSLIKSYSNKAKDKADQLKIKSGGNSFAWNMRYPGYKTFPGMVFYGSANIGPKAVPGKYKVRMTTKGETVEQEFEILKDPRVTASMEDLQAQFDFLTKVRDKVSEANMGITEIRKVKEVLKNAGNADAVKKLQTQLTVIENNIHQTKNQSRQDPLNYGIKVNNRLAFLMVDQGESDYRPTQQAEQVRLALTKEIDTQLQNLHTLVEANADLIKNQAPEKKAM